MLEPGWVGRRVSVRCVVGRNDAGREQYADVVGDLVHLGARTAVVDGRHGPVEVALDTVALARLAPPSTADELALEAVAARGLRPAVTEELGGWLLRADAGLTGRANSVLPLRAPGTNLDDALARAGAWYAERGLPLRLQIPTEARRLLDAELGERGWPASTDVHVMVRRLDADAAPVGSPSDPAVGLSDEPDESWLGVFRDGTADPAVARALLMRHDAVVFASVTDGTRTVAIGRGVVDDGWLGVSAIEVAPAMRRTGLGAAVLHALQRWGTERGAGRCYLQASSDNDAALALYQREGFWVHHDYRYRSAPDRADTGA